MQLKISHISLLSVDTTKQVLVSLFILLRASTLSTVTYAPGTLQSLQSLLVAMLERANAHYDEDTPRKY